MSTDFERLNIVLAARDREFARAMDRNTRRIERFERRSQKSLTGASRHFDTLGRAAKIATPLIAGLGAAAVIANLRSTVAELDDIGKTADRIGLSTDALQELRAVAESAGVSQSGLDTAMEKFSKGIGEATMGIGQARIALEELNLNADELASMPLDAALALVAERMSRVEAPTQRTALAMQLFGRSGAGMLNLLREGADGMADMRAKARELGVVIDEDLIRNAEGAQDQLDIMSRVIRANLNAALVELAPLLVGSVTAIADLVRGLSAAAEATREFFNPQTDLQRATDQVVEALGDEIRQSQILERAMGQGINLSVDMARQKLTEARARHENAKAAITEARQIALASGEYDALGERIDVARDALTALGDPKLTNMEQIESAQQRLVELQLKRQALLKTDEALAAQYERTLSNIAELEDGLANAAGGTVSIGASPIIEPSAREEISATGAAARTAVPEVSDLAEVVAQVSETLKSAAGAGADYATRVEALQEQHATGKISAEDYARGLGKIEEEVKRVAQAADEMEATFADAFASVIFDSKDAGDALRDFARSWLRQGFVNTVQPVFNGLFSGVSRALFGGLPSFEGGGYTGSGPRSGGVDGKGGFISILHPDERVEDMRRSGGAAGQGGVLTLRVDAAPGITVDVVRREAARVNVEMMTAAGEQQRQDARRA